MATQYLVLLDNDYNVTDTYEFTGKFEYVDRNSFILREVQNQATELDNYFPPPIIDPDTNAIVPPPNTTGAVWDDPGPLFDAVGEWVDNPQVLPLGVADLNFFGVDQPFVLVSTLQPSYTEAEAFYWAKRLSMYWLWDTYKNNVDVWHSIPNPTLTLADLELDYQQQYQDATDATTYAELQALTLITPQ